MSKTELKQIWETRIAEYRASGQSAKAWCATHDVTPRQLWYWMRKHKSRPDANSNTAQWLPVEVSERELMDHGKALLVRVGQASIEVKPGFDPALFSEIVRTLVAIC